MANGLRTAVWRVVLLLTLAALAWPVEAQQELDDVRKTTKRVEPVYPPVAQRVGLSGTVKMIVLVTPQGNVKAVRTVGGNPVLVSWAEDAVKQWKFEVSKTESSVPVAIQFGRKQ
jgi:TonB family protein